MDSGGHGGEGDGEGGMEWDRVYGAEIFRGCLSLQWKAMILPSAKCMCTMVYTHWCVDLAENDLPVPKPHDGKVSEVG